jgi:hypothetical protein
VFATAGIIAPPVVVLSMEPEVIAEIASCVVVALVVVELPTMVRLPFTVEDAEEINPPVSVERLVTARVLWRILEPVVVAPPSMVRPVALVFPPMVEEAVRIILCTVEVGARYAVAPEPFTSQLLPKT